MSRTFGRASQRAFDSALIAAIVCIVAYTGWHILDASRVLRQAAQRPAQNTYRTGEQLPLVDIIAATPKTLAVVLSSSCRFCAMSVPFYRELIQEYGRSSTQAQPGAQIVALCQESRERCQAYLDRERLAFDAVVSATDRQMKLVDTPTLLLLDQSRYVRRIWVGYQERAGQTAIRDVLRSSIVTVPQ